MGLAGGRCGDRDSGRHQCADHELRGRSRQPARAAPQPATTGLATYGFRVTVSTDSGSTPGSWQSGTTADGVAFLAANTPTVVTTSAVAWGIESGWNTTSTGTVTVEALTTGGWASTTVSYPWEISFNILGGGASASCG
ncbi:MAG TPA: hypothetical protein VK015_07190 [Microbacterium sp.]|nr:hypothetical protein [Microbacterium sp.]